MDIKQIKALADAKAAEALEEYGKEQPDLDKAKALEAEAEAYHKRLKAMQKLVTIKADAQPQEQPKPLVQVTADETDKKAEVTTWRYGEFLKAIANGDSAVQPYKTEDPEWERGYDMVKALRVKAPTGASVHTPADGGFLVQEDYLGFLSKPDLMLGGILPKVRRFTISGSADSLAWVTIDETSRATGSRWGGVQGYWLAEADQITSSKPQFKRERVELQKLGALAYATGEMLQDAAQLETVIGQAMREELTFLVENAILNAGTGAGMPTGVLHAANNARVTVAKETGQAADTIVSENVMKMYTRRWSGGNYVWYIGQDVMYELMNMDLAIGAGGQLTFMPPGALRDRPHGMLLGYPIMENEYSPALGDANDIALVDLGQYAYITKGDIQYATSIHIRFDYDETCFRFLMRCNGRPTWSDAVTPFQATGHTISPYIGLAERA